MQNNGYQGHVINECIFPKMWAVRNRGCRNFGIKSVLFLTSEVLRVTLLDRIHGFDGASVQASD